MLKERQHLGGASRGPHQLQSVRLDATIPDDTAAPYYGPLSNSALAASGCTGVPSGSWAHRCYASTSYGRVATVTEQNTTLSYGYDDGHQRAVQAESQSGSLIDTLHYLWGPAGAFSEAEIYPTVSGSTPVERHDHIMLAGGLAGEYWAKGQCPAAPATFTVTSTKTLYFHSDPEGTVTSITGTATEQDSYDAPRPVPYAAAVTCFAQTGWRGAGRPVSARQLARSVSISGP